jgi:hypothetical protein
MIDRDVFLAAAKAIRVRNFDAIDEDTGRIDVIVDGAHRFVDVAEMLVWLVAEADAVRAEREVLKDAVEDLLDAYEASGCDCTSEATCYVHGESPVVGAKKALASLSKGGE